MKLRSQQRDRARDKKTLLAVLRQEAREMNSAEIRHAYMPWLTTTIINSIGEALQADGLVDCDLVDAPFVSAGVKAFGGQPKIRVFRLAASKQLVEA